MTNKALFIQIMETVSDEDDRPWDTNSSAYVSLDKWGRGEDESTLVSCDSKGLISIWLPNTSVWSYTMMLSPRDQGRVYGALIVKWLGWDYTSLPIPTVS